MDAPRRSKETSAIAARLLAPQAQVSLEDLAAHWTAAAISATLPGHGALAGDLVLANRIRGALGRQLMTCASADAIAGRPCPWWPPCALDLMFREQARLGRHGIPKPWVLALHKDRLDLVVRLTLFGFAVEWAGAVAQALCTALNRYVDWRARAGGLFVPPARVQHLAITDTRVPMPRPRVSVALDFVTPADAAGDDPLDRPATVIGRLARRIDLMARWMDVAIVADWRALMAVWTSLDYGTAELTRSALERRSGREGREFTQSLVAGTLLASGDLAPVWPILVLGQLTHVGRAATAGLGRYVLR